MRVSRVTPINSMAVCHLPPKWSQGTHHQQPLMPGSTHHPHYPLVDTAMSQTSCYRWNYGNRYRRLQEHLFLLKCISASLPHALRFFPRASKVYLLQESRCNIAILGTLVVTYDVACVMMLTHLFTNPFSLCTASTISQVVHVNRDLTIRSYPRQPRSWNTRLSFGSA